MDTFQVGFKVILQLENHLIYFRFIKDVAFRPLYPPEIEILVNVRATEHVFLLTNTYKSLQVIDRDL